MTSLKRIIKTSLKHLLRRLGLKLIRSNINSDYDLKRQKFIRDADITTVIDIGANVGQYGQQLRHFGFTGEILSFEPYGEAFENLSRTAHTDPNWKVYNYALGEKNGVTKLYLATFSPSNSLLFPAISLIESLPSSESIGEQLVKLTTLDSILEDFGQQWETDHVMLKIDTQGSELSVLKGATILLERIKLLELELSFEELYIGQALFDEIYDFVQRAGFKIIAISPGYSDRMTGHTVQVDVILKKQE